MEVVNVWRDIQQNTLLKWNNKKPCKQSPTTAICIYNWTQVDHPYFSELSSSTPQADCNSSDSDTGALVDEGSTVFFWLLHCISPLDSWSEGKWAKSFITVEILTNRRSYRKCLTVNKSGKMTPQRSVSVGVFVKTLTWNWTVCFLKKQNVQDIFMTFRRFTLVAFMLGAGICISEAHVDIVFDSMKCKV